MNAYSATYQDIAKGSPFASLDDFMQKSRLRASSTLSNLKTQFNSTAHNISAMSWEQRGNLAKNVGKNIGFGMALKTTVSAIAMAAIGGLPAALLAAAVVTGIQSYKNFKKQRDLEDGHEKFRQYLWANKYKTAFSIAAGTVLGGASTGFSIENAMADELDKVVPEDTSPPESNSSPAESDVIENAPTAKETIARSLESYSAENFKAWPAEDVEQRLTLMQRDTPPKWVVNDMVAFLAQPGASIEDLQLAQDISETYLDHNSDTISTRSVDDLAFVKSRIASLESLEAASSDVDIQVIADLDVAADIDLSDDQVVVINEDVTDLEVSLDEKISTLNPEDFEQFDQQAVKETLRAMGSENPPTWAVNNMVMFLAPNGASLEDLKLAEEISTTYLDHSSDGISTRSTEDLASVQRRLAVHESAAEATAALAKEVKMPEATITPQVETEAENLASLTIEETNKSTVSEDGTLTKQFDYSTFDEDWIIRPNETVNVQLLAANGETAHSSLTYFGEETVPTNNFLRSASECFSRFFGDAFKTAANDTSLNSLMEHCENSDQFPKEAVALRMP